MMMRLPTRALAIAQLTISICFAQQQYRFTPLGIPYRHASAFKLSDNGSAIGQYQSISQPVVFSPELGVVEISALKINGINASGDVVGATYPKGPPYGAKPFLSRFPYAPADVIDLSTVFGWTEGEAFGINDLGDIVAGGIGGDDQSYNWFPGLNAGAIAINNARQVVGVSYSPPDQEGRQLATYFLYSPGKGVTVLPGWPGVLNNNGDILFGLIGPIQTATGQIPLPSGYTWISMNDSDQAVGFTTPVTFFQQPSDAFFFSRDTGLIDLSTRVLNPEAYLEITPFGINNRGQIGVNYTVSVNPNVQPYQGAGLLVPVSGPSAEQPPQIPAQRSVVRLSDVPTRRNFNVNGVPLETVK